MAENRIKKLRTEAGLTQAQLGEAIGKHRTQVNAIENGKQKLTLPLMEKLATVLDCSPADLLPNAEVRPAELTKSVRLLGHVAAGDWRESYEWPHDEQVMISIPPLKQEFQGLFALEVVGESMNLTVGPGSILICANVFHNPDMEIKDGNLVIVERTDPKTGLIEATVKRYREIEGKHWLYAESNKPEYAAPIPLPGPNGDPDAAERNGVQIIARVVKAIVEL